MIAGFQPSTVSPQWVATPRPLAFWCFFLQRAMFMKQIHPIFNNGTFWEKKTKPKLNTFMKTWTIISHFIFPTSRSEKNKSAIFFPDPLAKKSHPFDQKNDHFCPMFLPEFPQKHPPIKTWRSPFHVWWGGFYWGPASLKADWWNHWDWPDGNPEKKLQER